MSAPKPRDQTLTAVASRSTTALTFDADDVQGELAERMCVRATADVWNRLDVGLSSFRPYP